MRNVYERVKHIWTSWSATALTLVAVLMLSGMSVAQMRRQEAFASPQEASQALFAAVLSGKESSIEKVLGGGRELIATDDSVEDQHDREIFIEKYRQMHRVVQERDGKTLLYIGAENWPFPVPLVAKGGKWYFDSDSGAEEIVFRRIGENEAAVIEICRRLSAGVDESAADNAPSRDPGVEHARHLIEADAKGPRAGATDERQSQRPLHGYYFRKVETAKAVGGDLIVAYPAEYRSSGVMTFVVTREGAVYEKDLGRRTPSLVDAKTTWKRDGSWVLVN